MFFTPLLSYVFKCVCPCKNNPCYFYYVYVNVKRKTSLLFLTGFFGCIPRFYNSFPHFFTTLWESLRSLAHSNCVNFFALTRLLCAQCYVIKRTSYTNTRTLRLRVRFKYGSFYRRFQSFQSLFESLFSLVSIAIWIYFNRLRNTGAKLFCIWIFLSAAFFSIRESTSRVLWLTQSFRGILDLFENDQFPVAQKNKVTRRLSKYYKFWHTFGPYAFLVTTSGAIQ